MTGLGLWGRERVQIGSVPLARAERMARRLFRGERRGLEVSAYDPEFQVLKLIVKFIF